MFSPPLSARADSVQSDDRRPQALVISAHADHQGARAAARWAERLGNEAADTVLSTDGDLEERVAAAERVLVLDPGVIAAWRGFGPRASSRERLALLARLAGRPDRITWASTASQAAQWVDAA
jgi:hypothetical protein